MKIPLFDPKILVVLLAQALMVPCGLYAQEPVKEEVKEGKGGPSFKVSSWGDWKGPELFVRNDSKWKKLEILDLGYSGDIPFKRSEPIVLAKKVKGEKGDTYLPVVTVTVPEECQEPLVMLVTAEGESTRSFVVDLNPKEFPWGSYRFVNFTNAKLVGMASKTNFSIDPGKIHMFNPEKEKNSRLAIQVKAIRGENTEMVYSNMVINRPSKRMLVFFHPAKDPGGTERIETRCLVDFRQQ